MLLKIEYLESLCTPTTPSRSVLEFGGDDLCTIGEILSKASIKSMSGLDGVIVEKSSWHRVRAVVARLTCDDYSVLRPYASMGSYRGFFEGRAWISDSMILDR